MGTGSHARRQLILISILCALALGIALYSQNQWAMLPCAWCVLQRAQMAGLVLLGVIGFVIPGGWLLGAVALLSLLLSVSGVAAALWLHFKASSSTSCALTLADRIVNGLGLDRLWPDMFTALASCADAAVDLWGIPYVFYSLGIFLVCIWLSSTAWASLRCADA